MLKRAAIALVLVAAAVAGLWAADVVAARRWVLAVVGPEPLLSLPPHEYPKANPPIRMLSPGEPLRVLRVRYGKDFESIEVEAGHGQVGWVLVGSGVQVLSRGRQNGG